MILFIVHIRVICTNGCHIFNIDIVHLQYLSKSCNDDVGYLRSEFEYFLKGFGPVHSPTQINFSPSRSRCALSNQHHFNIKVHFHPPKKSPKNLKKMRKIKINFVKRERIRLDALSNVETYINREISTSSTESIPFYSLNKVRFNRNQRKTT